jgi:hypothetical protein
MKKILTSSIMTMMVTASLICPLKAADAGGAKKPAPVTVAACELARDYLVKCQSLKDARVPINSPALVGLGCQYTYLKCVQKGANMKPKPPAPQHQNGPSAGTSSGIPEK